MSAAALLAAVRAAVQRRDPVFPQQDSFVNDPSQFIVACCTRRAGKSTGLGRRFKKTMDKYPGCLVRYIAMTRDSAKDIMWNELQNLSERGKWDCQFLDSSLTMLAPNGSKLRLYGADMRNFVRRLRGAKTAANAIDEAQDFNPDTLVDLVDNILTPTMADYEESWLGITGTPGPVPRGLFYDITQGDGEYSKHSWSIYQNPYIHNAKEFVDKLKARKKWADNNPTLLREWYGKWVLDLDSLLVKYDQAADYKDLPMAKYTYIMGIDLGFNDADAIAVLAWADSSPTTYLVEEMVAPNQGLTELVQQIQRLQSKYDIAKLVIDEGGLGKKLAEELRRRHHIPVQPAEKSRKMENVAFLNDALRTGLFKAKSQSRFAQDSYSVQIDDDKTTPDKIVIKKGFHSDIIDAVLYAFKESPAFTYQAPQVKPKYQTPEWYAEEVTGMEKSAEEHFKKVEEMEKGESGDMWPLERGN